MELEIRAENIHETPPLPWGLSWEHLSIPAGPSASPLGVDQGRLWLQSVCKHFGVFFVKNPNLPELTVPPLLCPCAPSPHAESLWMSGQDRAKFLKGPTVG